MTALAPVGPADVEALHAFLAVADLTVTGLDDPGVRLWIQRDGDGRITGSTGFELSADGRHALIRSVAVDPALRSAGLGSTLARHALPPALGARGCSRAGRVRSGAASASRRPIATRSPPRCPMPARSSRSARPVSWRARSRGRDRSGRRRMTRPRLAG
ncbi:GNAT family N-acetyltransferase [Clavibacter michiganensis]|uniref:GNAT family N-acetyltransferase n=1 Tax=Clavibacter michiganensis TaxID=28447 RepID=UPI00311F412D